MFNRASKQIQARIQSLQTHLSNENPVLVDVIEQFKELDKVAYSLGLLNPDESFATKIAWWPLISVLGTFSAGKSTFINEYLGNKLQQTGNQAVDDRFTVICFSQGQKITVLPGLALDADPRFPFYQISEEIEKVAKGEGGRIDTYLQLKTCPSNKLRGKILIDSPGFDADEQRNSTLRITDHIIDLSDLVLVFFDARHPEPGAMQDTLEHLVAGTVRRNDANKMLFILNQIDTAAQEDNAEDVIGAWQRAIAQGGLVSGRFYAIYSEQAAVPIADESLRQRYRARRDGDLAEIYQRMSDVGIERVYRIIGSLEHVANHIEHQVISRLTDSFKRWYKRVMLLDVLIMVPLLAVLVALTADAGYWEGLTFNPPLLGDLGSPTTGRTIIIVMLISVALLIHFSVRKVVASHIARQLSKHDKVGHLSHAFLRNTRWWRSIFYPVPTGWVRANKRRVTKAREAADHLVEVLNDQYANPSGDFKRPQPTLEQVALASSDAASPAGQHLSSAN